MRLILACILLIQFLFNANLLVGQTYVSGELYTGTNDYVSYHAGNLPIIISVSHGGLLEPASIPNRSCAGCVTSNDTNTRALGLSVQEALKEITGCEVHLVVNELRRRKLDANREIVEAADGNAEAEVAWTEYHAFLDSAKAEVQRSWEKGIFIDLHGHGHDIQRLELGYRLSGSQLRMSDSQIDQISLNSLPIRALVERSPLSLSDIVRGEISMGSLFDLQQFDAVPSEAISAPSSGQPYFRGGYITDRYGSKSGGEIDAIQIECHQDVRFNDNERERFADSLAVVLLDYLQMHYFEDLPSNYCNTTAIFKNNSFQEFKVFPNPTCNYLYLPADLIGGNVSIYNSVGQKVLFTANTSQINIEQFSNGWYLILVENKNKIHRQRVSIQCH